MGSYTFLYNVTDFPTGSMCVTKVNQEDQDAMKDYPAHDLWHKAAKKVCSIIITLLLAA